MQSYKIIPKLALISFVFMLSACSNADPMTKNNSPMQQPQPTYDHNSAHLQHSKDYMKAMSQMHTQMRAVESNNVDVAFIQGMIPHHQGAIDMADMVLQYSQDTSIKSLANQIKQEQQSEIAYMKNWLNTKSN